MTPSLGLRVAVIDDEPPARRKLKTLLAQRAEVSSVLEATEGVAAVELIEREAPDLVFLDVQMPRVNGFQVVESLAKAPPVIFVTAHDQYAVRAFDAQAIDYLLKPVDPDRFTQALDRFLSASNGRLGTTLNRALPTTAHRIDHLLVRRSQRLLVVPLQEVELLQSDRNYVDVYTANESYSLRSSLSELEARLPEPDFVRIHRSRVVRISSIQEMTALGHGDLEVRLHSGRMVRWSRRYRDAATGLFGM